MIVTAEQSHFQFKTSFLPCAVLQITQNDVEAIEQQLTDTVRRAPNFFIGAPVIIDCEKIKTQGSFNFAKLKALLLANGLIPIGVRGGNEEQIAEAILGGFPALPISRSTLSDPPAAKKKDEPFPLTKLVTKPIRSGMQIYAKESDLIVTASVSPGAELLADGNIHVYGPLRGRAMAGVQGNLQARIFCGSLYAELVSVGGYYLTKEDMQSLPALKGMVQIYLQDEKLRIEAI